MGRRVDGRDVWLYENFQRNRKILDKGGRICWRLKNRNSWTYKIIISQNNFQTDIIIFSISPAPNPPLTTTTKKKNLQWKKKKKKVKLFLPLSPLKWSTQLSQAPWNSHSLFVSKKVNYLAVFCANSCLIVKVVVDNTRQSLKKAPLNFLPNPGEDFIYQYFYYMNNLHYIFNSLMKINLLTIVPLMILFNWRRDINYCQKT